MEEIKQEPIYLNYGNDAQIEQNSFLKSVSDNVEGYLSLLSWSSKRKDLFRKAYLDIMSRGVTGANNSRGVWDIEYNGDNIDLDSKSKKEREMYGAAAYFILQLMNSLLEAKKQEEKVKKDLPLFDNKYFVSLLQGLIGHRKYGGRDWDVSEWNDLDEANKDGIRGTSNRAKELAYYLELYGNSLKEGEHNFEGGPFSDLNDFKSRLSNAVAALRSVDPNDDKDALNKIGLKSSDYLSTGADDIITYNNLQMKRSDAILLRDKLLEEDIKNQKKLKDLAAYNNTLFIVRGSNKLQGRNPVELKEKYKDTSSLLAGLNSYAQRNIKSLSGDEYSELYGAFKYLAKDPIDNETLNTLKKSSSGLYRNASLNRFKKINGVDNLIWDTASQLVIQILNRDLYNASKNQNRDLFAGTKTKEELKLAYLNNTEFTTADWEELAGIGLDIASIVDPEPFSAAALGVGAALSRNLAANQAPGKKSLKDHAWQAFDYLTGIVGAIPGLGDAALASKTLKNVAKWLPKLMRIPAYYDLMSNTPGMLNVANKAINGESLTVLDWKTLGQFMRGFTATRNINVQTRAQRKALLERGYEVSNRWDKRLGLTESKPIGESISPTVKLNVAGETKEIPISSKTKAELEKLLSKKGNDVEARSKVIRENPEVLAAAEKAGIKVKEKVTDADGKVTEKLSDSWNNSKVHYNESLRNARIFGNKFGILPKYARSSGNSFGETSTPIPKSYDNFENYIKSDRGIWNRLKYGSNRTLLGADRLNSKLYGLSSATSIKGILYSGNLEDKVSKELSNSFDVPERKMKRASKAISPKNSLLEGFLPNGEKFLAQYVKGKPGEEKILFIHNGQTTEVKGKSFGELKKNLGKLINETIVKALVNSKQTYSTEDPKWTKFVDSIKKLKRKGFLYKLGGTINRLKIQQYKQYLNK